MISDVEIILASAVRLGAVLGFAALGELVAQRAGTLNISVEAMMLGGAFGGAVGATVFASGPAGLVCGVLAGATVAAVHGNLSHRLTANPFVVGLTLNVLVLGLTSFLLAVVDLDIARVGVIEVPLLSDIPVIGQAFFAQRWPVLLLYALVPVVWWVLYRSRWGLDVRCVGESPQAADVTGVHVNARRRQALLVGGALAGLGGAYLAVGEVGVFTQNMTAGRGFIAIAAVIFGGWTIRGTLAGCALFGLADSARIALPILGVALNSQLLTAAPYLLTIVALVVFSRRAGAQPSALGTTFERGIT
ncbi:MAG TPA: ABC transporter permease [Acidimicrobiales bacterium]|nr:ABC transporter permease [Acidimicrobiales bacterium]